MDLTGRDYQNVINWTPVLDPDTGRITLSAGGSSGGVETTSVTINSSSQDVELLNTGGRQLSILLTDNSGLAEGLLISVFYGITGGPSVAKGPEIWNNAAFPMYTTTNAQWMIELGPDSPTVPGISANLQLPDSLVIEFVDLDKGTPNINARITLS